ncbi:hypothetical protein POM88_031519 [Heracleum sosnowskyi]|uniref:Uncharacterized protein n=1 Tax=Heracleum sosnowskyi TaxID=360622 RepID=A0AAD8HZ05_9APIA|nr:hypothetical protein POM88_031519 [Heracleum sosnowskyi]
MGILTLKPMGLSLFCFIIVLGTTQSYETLSIAQPPSTALSPASAPVSIEQPPDNIVLPPASAPTSIAEPPSSTALPPASAPVQQPVEPPSQAPSRHMPPSCDFE